jgi:hypothetical protein
LKIPAGKFQFLFVIFVCYTHHHQKISFQLSACQSCHVHCQMCFHNSQERMKEKIQIVSPSVKVSILMSCACDVSRKDSLTHVEQKTGNNTDAFDIVVTFQVGKLGQRIMTWVLFVYIPAYHAKPVSFHSHGPFISQTLHIAKL